MKRELSKRLGLKTPVDGLTEEEKQLADLIGNNVVETIYAKLPTARMKAVVALHFELGYDQETIGQMFGVRQEQIALDIRNIKKVLTGKSYHPHKPKVKLRVEDVMSMLMTLTTQ